MATASGKTGLVLDERYLRHETGDGHPERADRLRSVQAQLGDDGVLASVQRIEPVAAEIDRIARVHDQGYIERVRQACADGAAFIDVPDSAICPESYETARLAAGGAMAAADAVMQGRVGNAFCAVRPPGHHAERDLSMGFCLFNTIAITARYLQDRWNLSRVLILDWDVHHGNGTQHTFDADPTVFFCSMHEHPSFLYPGTGHPSECGTGAGEGTTLNLTMKPGAGDAEYQRAFETQFVPAAEAFQPDFLLLSAGFDAHARDPLAHIELTDAGFEWLTLETLALARRLCGGRIVSLLEGGYDLEALATCVSMHVELLAQHAR